MGFDGIESEAARGRRVAVGAEVTSTGVRFRVYAPKRRRVEVVFERSGQPAFRLEHEPDGHFSGAAAVPTGTLYRFRLDDESELYPDPASRFQPEGPHGPSEVIDPTAYRWTDLHWRGREPSGQVIYEMHVGTFTPEGTFAAATRELEELARFGVTTLEIMPVADFAGRFGWGYDGVALYAPTRLYGRPDDFRAFVDRAHALGLAVILDVVYNHLGPSGNYLAKFADTYFTDRYTNEWGIAIDYETDSNARAYFAANGAYWIEEFHLDGLRLDATQCIHDSSSKHVVQEIAERARAAAPERKLFIVAENEAQEAHHARPTARGGFGLDAMWNDDFHHSAFVAATGHREAYYTDTKGTPQELLSAVKWGFLFQGQFYTWQQRRRGTPALDLPPRSFVLYLENHDQVANSAAGRRLAALISPSRSRALTALLFLAPGTPMLFQGQEFGASAPFLYFADHEPELARLVAKGRSEFLAQFPSLRDPALALARPHDPETFARCKLDLGEREKNRAVYRFHEDLLRLRREDPTFRQQRREHLEGAVLGSEALLLRYATGTGQDRALIVNLGGDLDLTAFAEPLLAPPTAEGFRIFFSTEDPRYGGAGTPPIGPRGLGVVVADSAIVLAPANATGSAR